MNLESFAIGMGCGLALGLILAALGATLHVRRIDRMTKGMQDLVNRSMADLRSLVDAVREIADRAHRVSLHVSSQYAPLREQVATLSREIEGVRQMIHAMAIGEDPPSP